MSAATHTAQLLGWSRPNAQPSGISSPQEECSKGRTPSTRRSAPGDKTDTQPEYGDHGHEQHSAHILPFRFAARLYRPVHNGPEPSSADHQVGCDNTPTHKPRIPPRPELRLAARGNMWTTSWARQAEIPPYPRFASGGISTRWVLSASLPAVRFTAESLRLEPEDALVPRSPRCTSNDNPPRHLHKKCDSPRSGV